MPQPVFTRRRFNQGLLAVALTGLAHHVKGAKKANLLLTDDKAYGPLVPDPKGLLDLPKGFHYEVISRLGSKMSDGLTVPDSADGMGCLPLNKDRIALVRNHELSPSKQSHQLLSSENVIDLAYDNDAANRPLPGGTSHIVYNVKTKQVEREFMSLLGTIRNCSGGITPWNSWLTCEESVAMPSDNLSKDHGYVFEIPADANGLTKAAPLKAMGRFNHEAACVDPRTSIVYLTEDRSDSLLYRFIPNAPGKLHEGGKLQALMVTGKPGMDSRNWQTKQMELGIELPCQWIDLDEVESPKDDLRLRGHAKGATLFARGEGIHWGDNELYFCCTSGGAKKLGQVMRYVPSPGEGTPSEAKQAGKLSLFVESTDKQSFDYGDNIVVAPNGHLIVCEDQYTEQVNNRLKGVTPDGSLYDFAKVRIQTEPAGACFSPDGTTMFVNLYSPTTTLAITGPWKKFNS